VPPETLHAHLPWQRRDEFLPRILALGLAPEIAFKGPDLDTLSAAELATVARTLQQANRRPTIHAPFFDLSPGAMEPRVRRLTMERLDQTLQAAGALGAHLVVVHPGYDRWRYPNLATVWAEQAAATFAELLVEAERLDCRLALENIYEESPATLVDLVERLASPWFGHCFDIGHWHLFGSVPQEEWLAAIAPRLLHLHLHDNCGESDQHLPVGAGCIDFTPVLRTLAALPAPPSITLEAHDPDALRQSLTRLQALTAKEFPA
jgi:sugar phosphate isomerase/epimerase